jgi:hypothetical protein
LAQHLDKNKELGTRIGTVILNPAAEEGDILWFPGWGVDNQRGGGARMLAAMATMNPTKRIVAFDEIEGLPISYKKSDTEDPFIQYTKLYRDAMARIIATDDRQPETQLAVSGQSRGGLLASYLAWLEKDGKGLLPKINTSNIIDTAKLIDHLSAVVFAAKVGGLDNLVQRKYADQVDKEEEATLASIKIDEPVNAGPKEMIAKVVDQWWLIEQMAKGGLAEVLAETLLSNRTNLDIWHGTANRGIKVQHMRPIVSGLGRIGNASGLGSRLRYFEAPTGHYSEGHTARYARIASFAAK